MTNKRNYIIAIVALAVCAAVFAGLYFYGQFVSTPQKVALTDARKGIDMYMNDKINIPVIGLVENMSYFKCPGCGEEHYIFGMSRADETAEKYNIPRVARIPINPDFAALVDRGEIEKFSGDWLNELADAIL